MILDKRYRSFIYAVSRGPQLVVCAYETCCYIIIRTVGIPRTVAAVVPFCWRVDAVMERTGEKRVRRKSRKVSETEISVEESPPVKRRKKNARGPSGATSASGHAGSEVKRGRPPSERAKKKRLMVSLDVMEHHLNVGEGGATPGSCTVTVGNGEGGEGGGGEGGKGGEEAAIRRPQVDIKFKNSKFMVSLQASQCYSEIIIILYL